ncbi:MAG: outer membrane beta-barrel protein [bacterium]|nr:outer membrane beta-barrel protein [bacterium]
MRMQVAILVAMTIASTAAHAVEKHFYFGGSIGEEADLVSFPTDVVPPDVAVRAEDRVVKFFGGLHLGDHLGVELAYHDFGAQNCCSSILSSPNFGFDINVDGYSAAFVARLPVRRFAFFGKLGYLFWDADGRLYRMWPPRTDPYSADGSAPMAGAGTEFSVTNHLGVRLEWEYFDFDDAAPYEAVYEEISMLSAGIQYRF